MMASGVLLAVVAIFWVLAFMTGRRFGVLGLALAAGALLSSLWSGELIRLVDQAGVSVATISTAGLVSVALVLAPAILLLFSGPSYGGKKGRAVGAILFAVFATSLITEPLSSALILDSAGRSVFDFMLHYQVYIVTVGVIISLLDLLAVHTRRAASGKAKH